MIEQSQSDRSSLFGYFLVFSGDRLVSFTEQPELMRETWSRLTFAHAYEDTLITVGDIEGTPCYAVDMHHQQPDAEDVFTHSLRSMLLSSGGENLDVLARAWQLVLFRRTHRFCGQCGNSMRQVDWEMAMHCDQCKHRCYPRVSPCVIVAIRRHNSILLAQGKQQRQRGFFSTLAGFVESGESLEQAIHREVYEEVGIQVKNIEYFGSQPWPFPHSLMVGFFAEYASGDINVDNDEIEQAYWFDIDDLPTVPPNLSIAGQLIEEMVARIKAGQ